MWKMQLLFLQLGVVLEPLFLLLQENFQFQETEMLRHDQYSGYTQFSQDSPRFSSWGWPGSPDEGLLCSRAEGRRVSALLHWLPSSPCGNCCRNLYKDSFGIACWHSRGLLHLDTSLLFPGQVPSRTRAFPQSLQVPFISGSWTDLEFPLLPTPERPGLIPGCCLSVPPSFVCYANS